MKNILRTTLIVLLITLSLTSCYDEYMDPVPKTSISDLSAFDTKSRIDAQVLGIYAAFKNGQYLGGRYQAFSDIRNDEFLNLQTNGVTGLLTWNHNITASTNEVQNIWEAIYSGINRINMFVEGLEANKTKILDQKILTEAELNGYKGEALALRGLAYFHIIQLYAKPFKSGPQNLGAILRLTASKSGADNSMPRETLEKTYAQILLDLNDAETLLPTVAAGTANSAVYTTRVHKNTVIALKTRVYLNKEDWDNVLTEGNKIVPSAAPYRAAAGVANGIVATYETIFRTPYTTSESIFSMPMGAAELPGTQNGIAHYFSVSPVGNNEYPLNPTSQIWSSTEFKATDARKVLTNTTTVGGVVYTFLKKYTTFPHTDWVPVIRYSEVLLNLAEAEARKSGVNARALALLNAVYQRSNPTEPAYTAANFANVEAFVSRLMLERRIEFLGEGLISMDVQRKLSPFRAKGIVGELTATSPAYVYPIPQTELNTNLLVQQN
jgi:starch-binding outer membrane protein, SusD/RagB family